MNKQAIFTTVGRLKHSVPESFNFTIARVKYVSRDEYSYSGNFPDLRIFQKDAEDWAWEREVRLVVTQDVSGLIPNSPKDIPGLKIDIDFEQLVEQIIDYPST